MHGALVEAAAADPQQGAEEEEQQEDEGEEGAGPGPSSREHVLLSYYSSRSLRRWAHAPFASIRLCNSFKQPIERRLIRLSSLIIPHPSVSVCCPPCLVVLVVWY